jgi:hypothetical protein
LWIFAFFKRKNSDFRGSFGSLQGKKRAKRTFLGLKWAKARQTPRSKKEGGVLKFYLPFYIFPKQVRVIVHLINNLALKGRGRLFFNGGCTQGFNTF